MSAPNRKPKRWEEYKKEWEIPEPRTDEPVGLYPRQSSKRQKKNNRQSFEKQTIDAVEDLKRRGWTEDLIMLYDKDMGTSAARDLEDREDMSQMIADIRAKRIRTVRAAEVDRLFRDEDRIDSNLFIKICREADCLVITDRMTYDLSKSSHRKWFRDEVDRSWEFYESQILIRASEHRDRAQSQGLYTGGAVAVGFIIDKTKGSPSYKKYIPYPHMGQKVLEIFQDLYDCGVSIGFVARRLEQLPYVIPAEETWVREQGLFTTNLIPVPGNKLDGEGNPIPVGYKLSHQTLRRMIRNRVYVGDWSYNGEWIEGNHEGIIPDTLFDEVNRMLDEQEAQAIPRNHHTATSSVVHNLLAVGPENTEHMYISVQHSDQVYRIMEVQGINCKAHASIKIDDIEREFISKFREKLVNRKEFENYEKNLKEENSKKNERKETLSSLISDLDEQIEGITLTLKSPKLEPYERDEFIDERHRAKTRRDNLQKELKILQQPISSFHKFDDLIEQMGTYWDRYPLDERQGLINALVKKIYIQSLSCHFIKVTIQWKWFPEDIGIIWRSQPASKQWTPEEDEILKTMYLHATPLEILTALPYRSWDACVMRATTHEVKRQVICSLSKHLRSFNLDKDYDHLRSQLSMEDMNTINTFKIPAENMPSRGVLCVTWTLR